MTHSRHLARSMERSSNVAERFFHSYKQRIRRMVCFMSKKGCDHFNAAWHAYINFERCQRRTERKKKSIAIRDVVPWKWLAPTSKISLSWMSSAWDAQQHPSLTIRNRSTMHLEA